MNIAGVLVHAKPGSADRVETLLAEVPGLEIHTRTDDNRFVVTVEEVKNTFISETLIDINRLEGVLSAAMVYQHSEDEHPQPHE